MDFTCAGGGAAKEKLPREKMKFTGCVSLPLSFFIPVGRKTSTISLFFLGFLRTSSIFRAIGKLCQQHPQCIPISSEESLLAESCLQVVKLTCLDGKPVEPNHRFYYAQSTTNDNSLEICGLDQLVFHLDLSNQSDNL